LKRGSGRSTTDHQSQRLRSALLITEVAAATILLLVAAFASRSVMELRAISTGFRVAGVQTFGVEILDYRHPLLSDAVMEDAAILDAVRRIPRVRYAGAGERVPTQGGRNNPTQEIMIDGRFN